MLKYLAALLTFCCGLTAASAEELRIDGSSRETYERSIKAMADSLPEQDKEAFAKGLINLIITRYPAARGAQGLALLQFMEPAVKAAHVTLNGVAKSEILARGKELTAPKRNGQMTSDAEIQTCLREKVAISNARVERDRFSHTLRFDVINNLPWAIAGIRVSYQIKSAGRSVPWAEDNFTTSISGGIEPGEKRSIDTSLLNISSDAPNALVAQLEVLDVADAGKKLLIREFGIMGWPDQKSQRTCR